LSEFSFVVNPDRNAVFIIANRTGGGTYFGTADYFQQVKLGGPQTLRGYHTWRFTGRSTLYNNLEVRLKVLDFTSYLLPGSIGLIGFNDIGRVWSANDTSNKWHDGYGGGIYIIPAELVLIQAAIGFSREGSLPYISIGFTF
jgi:outer membrane translocation and assembly module TamA